SITYTSHYLSLLFFLLLIPRTPRSTLFPYTTLFRSQATIRPRDTHRAGSQALAAGSPCGGFIQAFCPASRGCRDERRVPHLDIQDRKSTRLNSSHVAISYAVFCLKKKK